MVCSRVGSDPLGNELIRYLGERDLETRFIQRDEQHPTGTVTVKIDRADQPTYEIHEDVAWDYLDFDECWVDLFAQASAVYFGTLAQRSPISRSALMRGLDLADNALRVYDVNLRSPWFSRAVIESSLQRADVVKLNQHESDTLRELLPTAGRTPKDLVREWFDQYGVRLICLTLWPGRLHNRFAGGTDRPAGASNNGC